MRSLRTGPAERDRPGTPGPGTPFVSVGPAHGRDAKTGAQVEHGADTGRSCEALGSPEDHRSAGSDGNAKASRLSTTPSRSPSGCSRSAIKLQHGTFHLYIDAIASKFRGRTAHEPLYPATCSDYVKVTATVPVVAGSGTGAYRGIHGNFSSTLTGYEDEKTQPCGGGFLAQIIELTGSGTVSS